MLKITEVTKEFKDGDNTIKAVNNVNLELDKGSFVAIIGPSGSGKSTLLTIMGALQKPSSGQIEIDGIELYDMSEKERSSLRFNKIGFILQASNLVPFLNVEDQFKLKNKYSKDKTVSLQDDLFTKLKIDHLKRKYPDQLSGGERQRVSIALSLALRPGIVLADEPTASLDSKKAFDVVNMLKYVSKEMDTTVVMVTHDTRMLVHCDRVFNMEDGILSEIDKDKEIAGI